MLLLFTANCSKTGELSGNGGRHAYTHAHELRYTVLGDIVGLDGFVHRSGYAYLLSELCSAYLIRTDAHGNPTVPELATVVPTQRNGGISADGKTITWHLRKGVRWSDGAPFTADDVVFSTRQVENPANDISDRDGWDLITKIDEPDKYTVVYHLKKPYAPYAVTFFSTGSYTPAIVPKHLLAGLKNLNEDTSYNELPVTIGPFKFQQWKRGDSVTMVRNPLYWRGAPRLERIVFKIVPDLNTSLAQIRTHEVDLWLDVTPRFYVEAAKIPGITAIKGDGPWFDGLGFNLARPILRDLQVRRALRLALDRDALIRIIDDGLYVRSETFIPRSNPYFPDIPLVPFDLAKANALLDADGWRRGADGIRVKDGRRLSLDWAAIAGTSDTDSAIELIRAAWHRVGAEFVVKHYPISLLFAPAAQGGVYASGNFDVRSSFGALSVFPDVSYSYACYSLAPDGGNYSHWCDRRATADMDRLKSTYDFARQKRASDAVFRALADQVPAIIVDSRRNLAVYNDDLKHFEPASPTSFDSMMNVDI